MKHILLLTLVLVVTSSRAQIKDLETTATITDVTVYTASAEIHYEEAVKLPSGKSRVIFTGLTPHMIQNTLNISVSEDNVDILTVSQKKDYLKKNSATAKVEALEDSIQRMEVELGLMQVHKEALTQEKSLLFKDESIGGVAKGVKTEEIEKASAFFHKRYVEINTELYNIGRREIKLTKRHGEFKGELNELTTTTAQNTSNIILMVNSPSAQSVTFKFKFLTPKGGWGPLYDFKYQGPKQPLAFTFRANVFNATGIPWDNVGIKLSTANPIEGFDLPSLTAQQGTKTQPQSTEGITFTEVEVVNAIAEYNIQHRYTIPSNAKPYVVDVDAYTMPATFSYLLIPKLDPFGFLLGNVPEWNKYNLIPGQAHIYNMGTYMGKTFLNTYAANDTLSIYLGKDKSIQSTRQESNENKPRKIVGNYAVEITKIDILIQNNFTERLDILVVDQAPIFTSSSKIKLNVSNIGDATYNKKDGLIQWRYGLDPGQELPIDFKFEIKAPKELYESYGANSFYRQKYSWLGKHKRYRTISVPSF